MHTTFIINIYTNTLYPQCIHKYAYVNIITMYTDSLCVLSVKYIKSMKTSITTPTSFFVHQQRIKQQGYI